MLDGCILFSNIVFVIIIAVLLFVNLIQVDLVYDLAKECLCIEGFLLLFGTYFEESIYIIVE